MSYQDTSLWKRTLGQNDPNVEPLRNSFLRAREHAEFLLSKIRIDFPNLTVHDITHVDSLWNVADTIIGPNYSINPLEGYILGIAFLIHDAALSYDTVGGIDKLRDTIQWKDAYADGPAGTKDEDEFKKECDFDAIRALHAKYAEDIPTQTYKNDDDTTFYIIENEDYRTYFGELIGKIAASHHWSIDDVELKLDSQVNPIAEVPRDWEINAQKLACILRCADAGHIDNGRAPYNIYRSLSVNGVSRNHWESQIRLGQVRPNNKDTSKLLITSTKSFKKEEFAAWNVAYDAVRIFDEELKKSNNLLNSIDGDLVFPYSGVSGANSKEELAKYIKTEGWQPCNFVVHTSNIKLLIENLGGSTLYGEDNQLLVAMRELIQNARDAIHARQKLDDSFDNGKITIRLKKEGAEQFIEVEDNGIGMSMDCIKNHLLDFGSSYWKSSLSKFENPGLRSSSFTSIGKFGIGFYSVFMVAKSVEVRTKRYDKGNNEAKRVEFPAGLTLSPIISNDTKSAGTIVKIELKDDIKTDFCIKNMIHTYVDNVPISKMLSLIVAGLDCDVYYHEKCIHKDITSQAFNKKEWLRGLCLNCSKSSDRVFDQIAKSLEIIKDKYGCIRSVIFLYNNDFDYEGAPLMPSIVTVGGLLAYRNISISTLQDFSKIDSNLYDNGNGYIGYIDCRENIISRDRVFIDVPLKKSLQDLFMQKYFENHYYIIHLTDLSENYRRFFQFICQDNEVLDDIAKYNAKEIFSNNLQELSDLKEISILLKLHRYLFAGIISRPGEFRGRFGYGSFDEDIIDSRLMKIELMPESEYEEIVSKYMQIMIINPFDFGTDMVAGLWLNLKLMRSKLKKMIDWRLVDLESFFKKFEMFKDDSKLESLYEFFEHYLVDGNEEVFSSCLLSGYW